MGKSFRTGCLNQALLLPPSLHDWLPEKHLARFLVDVVKTLDLSSIYGSYEEKERRGHLATALGDKCYVIFALPYGVA